MSKNTQPASKPTSHTKISSEAAFVAPFPARVSNQTVGGSSEQNFALNVLQALNSQRHPIPKGFIPSWQCPTTFGSFSATPYPTHPQFAAGTSYSSPKAFHVTTQNESCQTDTPLLKDMSVQTDLSWGLDTDVLPHLTFKSLPLSKGPGCNSLPSQSVDTKDETRESPVTPPAHSADMFPSSQDIPDALSDCNSSVSRLDRLCSLVQTLFLEGTLRESDHEHLNSFQKQLLYYIVKRKYVHKYMGALEPNEKTSSFHQVRQLTQIDVLRRPEECFKFVLTRVLKHLRKRLEAEDPSKNSEARLYELYFGDVAKATNTPISDFYYPLTNNAKGHLHFNSAYLTRIFQSDSFCREVDSYAAEQIYIDFRQELLSKVASLFKRWERCLSDNPAIPEYSQQSILKYVIFSKHCKLPWTLSDVTQAAEKIRTALRDRRADFPPRDPRQEN